jgi:hypothetical protein
VWFNVLNCVVSDTSSKFTLVDYSVKIYAVGDMSQNCVP